MFPENRLLEILIIGAVALIVVGPKDLPILMRKVGQFVAKMRGMAAEFRASFDELARQSELDELRKEVEALRTTHQSVVADINPLGDDHVQNTFGDIEQSLGMPPHPMTAQPAVEAQASASAEPAAAPKPKRKPRAKAVKVAGGAT
jgi:sec-independent protein translocase protein TatB